MDDETYGPELDLGSIDCEEGVGTDYEAPADVSDLTDEQIQRLFSPDQPRSAKEE